MERLYRGRWTVLQGKGARRLSSRVLHTCGVGRERGWGCGEAGILLANPVEEVERGVGGAGGLSSRPSVRGRIGPN